MEFCLSGFPFEGCAPDVSAGALLGQFRPGARSGYRFYTSDKTAAVDEMLGMLGYIPSITECRGEANLGWPC